MPGDERPSLEFTDVDTRDRNRVLECYILLRDEMEAGYLENLDSFWETVSPDTDPAVVPRLVSAIADDGVAGAVLGVYLRNMGVGVILYSVVRPERRGQGVYAELRRRLIDRVNDAAQDASHEGGIGYLISELAADNPFLERYVGRWSAHVPDIEYRQPAVQGLESKQMKLVFQPISAAGPPTSDQVDRIVDEIYVRIYRMQGALRNV